MWYCITKELEAHNIFFNIAGKEGARDLGISHTAGMRRPGKICINRKLKTKNRKLRINTIAKVNRRAKVLYTGSALPADIWGHQGCGLAPSHIIAIERDSLRCTGIGTGYCRTIALRVFYGPYTTPYARITKELVIAWFRVYTFNMCGIPIINISKAWHAAFVHIKKQPKNIKKAASSSTSEIKTPYLAK